MRIVAAETNPGHWMAWTTEAPQDGYGGGTALDAVHGLCAAHGRDPKAFRLVKRASAVGRVVLDEGAGEPCPDWGGTGQYVGFIVVETCRVAAREA